MNWKNFRQKSSLWLDHHPNGRLLVLLSAPMLARPKDFEGEGRFHHSKLSWFTPMAAASLVSVWYGTLSTMLEDRMILAAKGQVTEDSLHQMHHILTMGHYAAMGVVLAMVCTIAFIRWVFHGAVCSLMNRTRPPLKFFWVHTTGAAVWLSLLVAVILYFMSQDPEHTNAKLNQLSAQHPWWCMSAMVLIYGVMRLSSRNSNAGMQGIYGENGRVLWVGLLGMVVLCTLLLGIAGAIHAVGH